MAEEERVPWYYRPLGIAFLALVVLGPLALPFVWRTPVWGPRERWIATVLILLYTALLAWQVCLGIELALSLVRPG